MNKTIPKRIFTGFIISFCIVVIIGVLVYFNVRNFLSSNRWESQTYQALARLEYVLSDLKDIENGSRGYIITGQENFLEPYRYASKVLKADLSSLESAISDNKAQIERLNNLKALITQKLNIQKELIEIRNTAGFNAASAVIKEESGKRMMDDIRRTVSVMKDVETDLLAQRIKQREVSTFDLFAVTGIMILLLFIADITIMVFLKKDLIARIKLKDLLQDSLEYSNMIINTVPNPLLVLDANLNVVTENRSFYRHFNYTKEEIEGKPFFELIKGRFDYLELRKLLHSIIPEDTSFENYELELSDSRIISMNARKLYRTFNDVHLILLGIEDITDRKKAEEVKKKADEEREELLKREQEARMEAEAAKAYYRSLFEYAPGLYLVLLPDDYQIVAVSEAYLKATMTRREEIMGKKLFEVFPDNPELPGADGVRNLNASLERVKREKQTDIMAVQLYPIRKPAETGGGFEDRYWSPINSPVLDPNGNLAYIIHRVEDVTEYIRLKKARSNALEAGHLQREKDLLETRAEHMEADIVLQSQRLQRLNEQLRETHQALLEAQRIASIGSWEYNIADDTLLVSEQVLKILDIRADEAVTHSNGWLRLINPGVHARVLKVIDYNFKNGVITDKERRIDRTDGEIRIIYIRKEAVNGSAGNLLKIKGTIQDITDKKRSEDELRRQKYLQDIIMELMPVGLWIIDNKGTVLRANKHAREIWAGAKYVGVEQYGEYKAWYHDTGVRLTNEMHAVSRALSRGESTHQEMLDIECFDGTRKTIFNSTVPYYDTERNIAGAIAVHQDITDIIRISEQLKESENKLLDAQKLARFGNYTIDVADNKMEWSDEIYNIYELDRNNPVPLAEKFWELIHPDDREELKKILTEKTEGSERVESEFRLLFPGGRIKYVHLIARLDFDTAGRLYRRQGVQIDITDRKLAQIELEKTLKELERSNMELEQFAYITSHDLQEPLRMISNYVKLLKQKYGVQLDEKANTFINFAADGAVRMNSLIKGLLSYSRITTQAKEPEQVDLNRVLHTLLRDLNLLIEDNNASVASCELPVVKADPLQMYQLFQNLIINAIKFKSERPPEININAGKGKDEWLFSIEDNGIGIDPEHLDRIFLIFQRLHERDKYEGVGLGLAICKKIVERHGGRIWAESQSGQGSVFYFTLPA